MEESFTAVSNEEIAETAPQEERPVNQFKVLTYNLAKFNSSVDSDTILEKIIDLKPDLIGFQEVDHITNLFNLYGLLNLFSTRNKVKEFFSAKNYFTKWDRASGPFEVFFLFAPIFLLFDGLLIAVNRDTFDVAEEDVGGEAEPLVLSRYFKYLIFGIERRIIQYSPVTFKPNGLEIDFFNTHLTDRNPEGEKPPVEGPREIEALKAGRFIAQNSDVSKGRVAILVGDLNYDSPSAEAELLNLHPSRSGAPLVDTFDEVNDLKDNPGVTLDKDNTIVKEEDSPEQSRRIDYIYVREPGNGPLRIVSSEVVLTDKVDGENMSDHYGLLTVFETN